MTTYVPNEPAPEPHRPELVPTSLLRHNLGVCHLPFPRHLSRITHQYTTNTPPSHRPPTCPIFPEGVYFVTTISWEGADRGGVLR
jgi:hypothetical protein